MYLINPFLVYYI